nr:putative ribonuclease h protein [Quercus suber]
MYPRPRVPWEILFPQAVWTLWLHRNKVIFQTGKIEEGTSACCVKKGVEFYAIVPNGPNKPRRTLVQVRWLKPLRGWTKLNTDGSVIGNPLKAGEGGLLRCNNGEWLAGFTLGNMSSTIAKLWALKDGLNMAKHMGIDSICIEMDAKFIVHLVSSPYVVNLMLEPLLTDCRNLILTFPNHTVTHVFKEINGYADCLARMGAALNHDFDVYLLYNPQDVVVDLLATEKAEIAFCNKLIVS